MFLSPEACAQVVALQKEKGAADQEITRQAPLSTVAALEGPVGDTRNMMRLQRGVADKSSSPAIVAQLDKLMGRA